MIRKFIQDLHENAIYVSESHGDLHDLWLEDGSYTTYWDSEMVDADYSLNPAYMPSVALSIGKCS